MELLIMHINEFVMIPADRVYKKRVCSFLASTFKQPKDNKEPLGLKTSGKAEKSRKKRVQSAKVTKGKKKMENVNKEKPQ